MKNKLALTLLFLLFIPPLFALTPLGTGEAEYVILFPEDQDFRTWAETLKTFRTLQGISTEIYSLAEIGSTAAQIKDWIQNAYYSWHVPPHAILLLGDVPQTGEGPSIPVLYYDCEGWMIPSDNLYADVDGDHLPEMLITRICAQTGADLEKMVQKVIDYETYPPMDPGFYDHPTLSGGWMDDQWFILCAEILYGYMEKIHGKSPNREYSGYTGVPPYWSSHPETYKLVDAFGPAGLGYIPETPSHLSDWGGNAARINQDINDGSFLVLHRGHGVEAGWVTPEYLIPDLNGLNNEALPFVFSFNARAGNFGSLNPCFGEVFHRMQHGALGVIAASGYVFPYLTDYFLLFFFDALFPDFMPDQGGKGLESTLQPGSALLQAKYALEGMSWQGPPQYKRHMYHLFHMMGEPYLTLYSEVPQTLEISHPFTLDLGATSFSVTAKAGASIALTVKEGDGGIALIGKGEGTGAPLKITILPQYEPRLLTVTVTKPNHLRYSGKVYIPEPGHLNPYGEGLAGSGGVVPVLSGQGFPIFGGDISLELNGGLGGAYSLLYVGLNPASLPFLGGELLVFPVEAILPISLSGPPGVPGAGSFDLSTPLYLSSLSLYLQMFVADPGAKKGVAMSNGLEIAFP